MVLPQPCHLLTGSLVCSISCGTRQTMRGLVCQPGSIPRLKHETICKSGDLFLFPPHPLQVLPSGQDAQVQSCMFREVIKLSETTSSLWNGNGTAYLGVVTGYFCFFFGGGRCYLARRPMAEGSWGRNSKKEPSWRGHRGRLLTSLLSLLSYSAQAHLSRGSTNQ